MFFNINTYAGVFKKENLLKVKNCKPINALQFNQKLLKGLL